MALVATALQAASTLDGSFPILGTKQEIRKAVLARRRAMSRAEAEQKSRALHDRLFALPEYQSARVLHCYVSSKDNEVDTRGLIEQALGQDKRVVVPVADFGSGALYHLEIEGLEDLRPVRFGLMEPRMAQGKTVEVSGLDLIIVPGIAFDPRGYRIGFGRGFYDRFLGAVRALKIGLAYQFQVVEHIPSQEHDVPVDRIVTEAQVYTV